MKEFLSLNIFNSIEDLENEFLGCQIAPNKFIERVIYILDGEDFSELYRISEKNFNKSKDCLIDEFDQTSLNYNEFLFDNWNQLLYNYLNSFYENELDENLISINEYLENVDIEFEIKKFSFNNFIDKIKLSIHELDTINQNGNINKFQELLINIFIEKYNALLNSLVSKKYSNFFNEFTVNKKRSTKKKFHFDLANGINPSFEGLRNRLVDEKLISNKTNYLTLENAFKSYGQSNVKIDWIGGKGKLGNFIKLLIKKEIITNHNHYKIAINIFSVDGKDIDNLRDTPDKESIKYIDLLEQIINKHFLPLK